MTKNQFNRAISKLKDINIIVEKLTAVKNDPNKFEGEIKEQTFSIDGFDFIVHGSVEQTHSIEYSEQKTFIVAVVQEHGEIIPVSRLQLKNLQNTIKTRLTQKQYA